MSHDQRMVEENNQLAERIGKLSAFLETDAAKALSPFEFDLLVGQVHSMMSYHSILTIRIKLSQSTQDPKRAVSLVS